MLQAFTEKKRNNFFSPIYLASRQFFAIFAGKIESLLYDNANNSEAHSRLFQDTARPKSVDIRFVFKGRATGEDSDIDI